MVVAVISAGVALAGFVATVVFGTMNANTASEAKEAAKDSARSAGKSADVAQAQLEASVEAQRASALPYVWADLRLREDGGMLTLQIGNSGPTVARNVTVTFDPPISEWCPDEERDEIRPLEGLCRDGLGSLAPGRIFMWNLGAVHRYFPNGGADPVPDVTVRINSDDSVGNRIPELTYVIQLKDLKWQAARGQGFGLIEGPLKDISSTLKEWKRSVT